LIKIFSLEDILFLSKNNDGKFSYFKDPDGMLLFFGCNQKNHLRVAFYIFNFNPFKPIESS